MKLIRTLCAALLAFACAADAGSDARLRAHVFAPTFKALDFDGTSDYTTRAADLTGIADGKAGTASFWARLDGGNGVVMRVLANANGRFEIIRTNANVYRMTGLDTGGSQIMVSSANTTSVASSTWVHVLMAWDLAAGTTQLYLDGVDRTNTTLAANSTIDYTRTSWAIAAQTTGATPFNGCIAELWFTTTYIDISTLANRRKFRTGNGQPAYLGAQGQLPTGSSPLLYAPSGGGLGNRGTGGKFTATGAPALCSSAP